MQPSICEAHRTVRDGRLTWPEVGTADLREAPAKLLQASADAILLGSAAVLSKTQRFALDEFGSDKRLARSGFIRLARANQRTSKKIWHPFRASPEQALAQMPNDSFVTSFW